MAFYIPDYDYKKGKELAEKLTGEEGELIKYYIKKKDEHIDKLNERIKEMSDVFKGIAKFVR